MQKNILIRTFFLLLLAFFLVEYLNPSAIGVRADFNPPPTSSTPVNNQAHPNSGTPSFTSHSMIQSETYRPGGIFPIAYYSSSVQPITDQTKSKEIFHPPVSST